MTTIRHQVQQRHLEQADAAPQLCLPPAPVLSTILTPPLQHGNSLETQRAVHMAQVLKLYRAHAQICALM